MNYVYLSPHFPSNYYPFVIKLREVGVNVLGICDTPYNQLPDSLKHHLTEYYRVTDMHNYDELLRVVEYFTHHYVSNRTTNTGWRPKRAPSNKSCATNASPPGSTTGDRMSTTIGPGGKSSCLIFWRIFSSGNEGRAGSVLPAFPPKTFEKDVFSQPISIGLNLSIHGF